MLRINKIVLLAAFAFASCTSGNTKDQKQKEAEPEFVFLADRFADIQVLRYQIEGFEELSPKQKVLSYYVYEAALCGRDIYFDQKYKHNLRIRKTLENILQTYTGDKNSDDYKKFVLYCKRFFFANGIHHHYAAEKMIPECSFSYFKQLVDKSDAAGLPLEGMTKDAFMQLMQKTIYDPSFDAKSVNLAAGVDNVKTSSNNFYENVTQKEAEEFYDNMQKANPSDKSSHGLNSKLIKEDGKLYEKVWKSGGMYGAAIDKIIFWLEKAVTVAENDIQKQTFEKLIKYYRSGDTKDFDDYSISWVKDTASRIDAVNGFIEVYLDAIGKKGSFESVVSMKDMEATKRIEAISKEARQEPEPLDALLLR